MGSEHRRADRKQKVVGKSELVGVRGTVARLAARSRQAAAPQQAAQVVRGLDAVREPPVLLGRRCESFDGAHCNAACAPLSVSCRAFLLSISHRELYYCCAK